MALSKSSLFRSIQSSTARIAGLEIWAVAGLVLAGLLSTRLLPAAAGAAVVFWLLRGLSSGRLTRRTPADWAILVLAGTIPVTLWVTTQPEVTFPQVYRLLAGMALFYALVNWATTPARLRWSAAGMILAGLSLVLIAPFSVAWPVNKLPLIPAWLYDRFALLVSDTIHPNVLAGYLVILLPVPLAMLLFAGRRLGWVPGLLVGVASCAMALVLVLTQSRGALIALAAALTALSVLRWRRGWLGLVFLGGIAGLVIYRLGFLTTLNLLSTGGAISNLELRAEIWSRAVYLIQDFPLTGVGMGSYQQVADRLYPFFLALPGSIPHAHNLFLQVAVDLGLPGLTAWLAIWMLVAASCWELFKTGRRSDDSWTAGLGAGLLASQLALAVHGLTDAVTWGMVRPAPLVWALWGLAFAGWRVAERHQREYAEEVLSQSTPEGKHA